MIADRVADQMIRGTVRDGIRIFDKFFAEWHTFEYNIVRPWKAGQLQLPRDLDGELEAMIARPSSAMNFRMMTRRERLAAGIDARLVVVEPSRAFKSLKRRVIASITDVTTPADKPGRASKIRQALFLGRRS